MKDKVENDGIEIDKLFGDVFNLKKSNSFIKGNIITIICPGLNKDDIDATIEGNVLNINGASKDFYSFNEEFTISRDVKSIDISLKNGILKAVLNVKPTNVEINFI